MHGLVLVLLAAEPSAWQTVATGPITIKTRTVPGSPIREVLAEGDLDAPALDIQQAVLDVTRFPKFMPYVKETKLIAADAGDGTRLVYTALDLPVVAGRDFVVKDRVVRGLEADGSGEFFTVWQIAEDVEPKKDHLVRVKTNTGSWRVRTEGKKSHVVYQFAVDPGGSIPPFLADMGNRNGVADIFRAVEKEARRLQKARSP